MEVDRYSSLADDSLLEQIPSKQEEEETSQNDLLPLEDEDPTPFDGVCGSLDRYSCFSDDILLEPCVASPQHKETRKYVAFAVNPVSNVTVVPRHDKELFYRAAEIRHFRSEHQKYVRTGLCSDPTEWIQLMSYEITSKLGCECC